jgi:hypothetical protein
LQFWCPVTTGRTTGLEIDQDTRHQRASWRLQRIGWAVMVLVVIAALAGLLGSGPLSRSRTSTTSGLQLEYERFARYQDPHRMTLRLPQSLVHAGRARVSISRTFLDGSTIESIVPQPEAQHLEGEWVAYLFRVTGGTGPATISFVITPQRIGRLVGGVRVQREGGGQSSELHLVQWTYP